MDSDSAPHAPHDRVAEVARAICEALCEANVNAYALEDPKSLARAAIAQLACPVSEDKGQPEILAAIQAIARKARCDDGTRTFDDCTRDLGWIDDECRRLLRRPIWDLTHPRASDQEGPSAS